MTNDNVSSMPTDQEHQPRDDHGRAARIAELRYSAQGFMLDGDPISLEDDEEGWLDALRRVLFPFQEVRCLSDGIGSFGGFSTPRSVSDFLAEIERKERKGLI